MLKAEKKMKPTRLIRTAVSGVGKTGFLGRVAKREGSSVHREIACARKGRRGTKIQDWLVSAGAGGRRRCTFFNEPWSGERGPSGREERSKDRTGATEDIRDFTFFPGLWAPHTFLFFGVTESGSAADTLGRCLGQGHAGTHTHTPAHTPLSLREQSLRSSRKPRKLGDEPEPAEMVVQWELSVELGAFNATVPVQSLVQASVRKLRSCKLCGMVKKKKVCLK